MCGGGGAPAAPDPRIAIQAQEDSDLRAENRSLARQAEKEAEVVESFAAEEDTTAPELLVPEPSSSPNGNGRVLGQHTGGQIVSATDEFSGMFGSQPSS